MTEVYIVSACRTPIGSFCGVFKSTPAHELGSVVIKETLTRAQISPGNVSEVIMGQALTAGQGQNPARQAALKAGLPINIPAYGINMLCGSGLRAVVAGYQAIKCGDASVVICGGQENMSMAPHTLLLRNPTKMGPSTLQDTMLIDGLTDAINKVHMGNTAEEIVKLYKLTREEQDEFAYKSQAKTRLAHENGGFVKEIVPVTITERRATIVVNKDEYPKFDTNLPDLAKLRPVFIKDGTVTAGNASGINDGAAAVLLCSSDECEKSNLKPLAKIIASAQTGLDPMQMGLGPITAIQLVLNKAKWSTSDVDLFELNEAFAAQSIACIRELELSEEKTNVNGGAIALGHPIGASGCRILVTLLHALKQRNGKKGVAALCIGGGMGIAIAVEIL